MNIARQNEYWDFSEVPKLVSHRLSTAFDHKFVLRRNKGEQTIYITWEAGPSRDAVDAVISEHFPRITFNSDVDMREYTSPIVIEGRLLTSYWYSLKRVGLFDGRAEDIPRLVASGENLEERNWLRFTPFEQALRDRNESRAIALFLAGASFERCLPGECLHECVILLPRLWTLMESKLLGADTSVDAMQCKRRRL
ncbi:MAG: hypothetical protein M0P63_03030 [Azoarcus sp.]|nr:hypothetical protein [Azoarcus sp.]